MWCCIFSLIYTCILLMCLLATTYYYKGKSAFNSYISGIQWWKKSIIDIHQKIFLIISFCAFGKILKPYIYLRSVLLQTNGYQMNGSKIQERRINQTFGVYLSIDGLTIPINHNHTHSIQPNTNEQFKFDTHLGKSHSQ